MLQAPWSHSKRPGSCCRVEASSPSKIVLFQTADNSPWERASPGRGPIAGLEPSSPRWYDPERGAGSAGCPKIGGTRGRGMAGGRALVKGRRLWLVASLLLAAVVLLSGYVRHMGPCG